jgi:hypothetical protein
VAKVDIKSRRYWEHTRNLWELGSLWELDGNTLGTKKNKKSLHVP